MPDRPGIAYQILGPIGDAGIDVDLDETPRERERVVLGIRLEDREPADQFLGLGERSVDGLYSAPRHDAAFRVQRVPVLHPALCRQVVEPGVPPVEVVAQLLAVHCRVALWRGLAEDQHEGRRFRCHDRLAPWKQQKNGLRRSAR